MLNQFQSITLLCEPDAIFEQEEDSRREVKKVWIEKARQTLRTIQLRDKLEKFLMMNTEVEGSDSEVTTQTIVLKPFEDSRAMLAL